MTSIEERIRKIDDIGREVVEVPEWADEEGALKLEIRSMTGTERAAILQRAVDSETGELDFASLYPQIIVATCFDPDTGEQAFSPPALQWLNDKSSKPLEQLASAGMRLSGLDAKAKERAATRFPE